MTSSGWSPWPFKLLASTESATYGFARLPVAWQMVTRRETVVDVVSRTVVEVVDVEAPRTVVEVVDVEAPRTVVVVVDPPRTVVEVVDVVDVDEPPRTVVVVVLRTVVVEAGKVVVVVVEVVEVVDVVVDVVLVVEVVVVVAPPLELGGLKVEALYAKDAEPGPAFVTARNLME